MFKEYAGDGYTFGKTHVAVKLFTAEGVVCFTLTGTSAPDRFGKVPTVVLGFKNVEIVNQAFADEVFRVWRGQHPEVGIEVRNASDNLQLMIHHARCHREAA